MTMSEKLFDEAKQTGELVGIAIALRALIRCLPVSIRERILLELDPETGADFERFYALGYELLEDHENQPDELTMTLYRSGIESVLMMISYDEYTDQPAN